MGFLDNSGDIILDAVLTDAGRKRLAEGNFNIGKFALGDDEIDYGLYDKNNTNGSAYYDLTILQTPVLEAFTNNVSSMKSRLMSYNANDILYLPVIEVANLSGQAPMYADNYYAVIVDQSTETQLGTRGAGVLNGNQVPNSAHHIRVDQGLDTDSLSPILTLENYDANLVESSYTIEIDNRFGTLFSITNQALNRSYIDDDNMALYLVLDTNSFGSVSAIDETNSAGSVIAGPRGTKLTFKVKSSLELETSTYLFTQLGTLGTAEFANTGGGSTLAADGWRYIDTIIKVTGVNTGVAVDIPIRFIKKI